MLPCEGVGCYFARAPRMLSGSTASESRRWEASPWEDQAKMKQKGHDPAADQVGVFLWGPGHARSNKAPVLLGGNK